LLATFTTRIRPGSAVSWREFQLAGGPSLGRGFFRFLPSRFLGPQQLTSEACGGCLMSGGRCLGQHGEQREGHERVSHEEGRREWLLGKRAFFHGEPQRSGIEATFQVEMPQPFIGDRHANVKQVKRGKIFGTGGKF
jgi:hypothetical protein